MGIALGLAAALVLSGCWVSSVNGLAEEGRFQTDPDVVIDKNLAGTWQKTSNHCTTTLTVTIKDRNYSLEASGSGGGCDEGKNNRYRAQLIKLDNRFFLDVFPRPDDVCEMCLPVHWIFLLTVDQEFMSLSPIDSEWLKKALEQKTVRLTTMQGNPDLLTASSSELKAFCRRYADDKEAFAPTPDFVFKRK